ncbi:uncharacterized protein LOC119098190 [Pollicipes pollicipes]|uniref:uncharacterized protein LOC119098190 n=1 Tax=Pollicipes pollicipes TaxID=41117 RepID=UPI0018853B55|nr:uncharacterized protein LOC119098190 [Pollicipes pollicipes]
MVRLTSALLLCLAGLAAAATSWPPHSHLSRPGYRHPIYVFSQWGKAHRASASGPDSPAEPNPDSASGPEPESPAEPDGSESSAIGATDELFFSWRDMDLDPRDRYTWQEAKDQCESRNLRLVSLDTREKNDRVADQIFDDDVAYSWTSGRQNSATDFVWGNGRLVSEGFTNWSPTGGDGFPQPDDREGPEDCLAVINNAYGDGVVWHDILCSREKHFVCEK